MWQRVNHFPKSRELTRKDLLKRNIGRYEALCAGSKSYAGSFDIMPRTFVLPHEYSKFIEAFYTEDRNMTKQKAATQVQTWYMILVVVDMTAHRHPTQTLPRLTPRHYQPLNNPNTTHNTTPQAVLVSAQEALEEANEALARAKRSYDPTAVEGAETRAAEAAKKVKSAGVDAQLALCPNYWILKPVRVCVSVCGGGWGTVCRAPCGSPLLPLSRSLLTLILPSCPYPHLEPP